MCPTPLAYGLLVPQGPGTGGGPVGQYRGDFQYRVLGEELAEERKRATFEFLVRRRHPDKVASYTVDPALMSQLGYRGCLRP
jgi:hypothetical protein